MSGKDEQELARWFRAALTGDERCYERFLGSVAGIVRGFARKNTIPGVDPEDIVQETLLAIHAKRHTWRADAPVLPWVFGIARYKMIDAFRRRGRRIEIDLDDIAETVAQPEVESMIDRDVARALAGLTPGQRSVVSAISIEGRSIAETAKRHHLTEGAVRIALHRGLAAITRRFGPG